MIGAEGFTFHQFTYFSSRQQIFACAVASNLEACKKVIKLIIYVFEEPRRLKRTRSSIVWTTLSSFSSKFYWLEGAICAADVANRNFSRFVSILRFKQTSVWQLDLTQLRNLISLMPSEGRRLWLGTQQVVTLAII